MQFRILMVALSCALLAAFGSARAAAPPADIYPQHSIRLLVPYPPGEAGDIVGRLLSSRLGENFGQQIVVDNRGGGAQLIATEIAGQVQIMCTSPLPAMPHVKSGKLRALAITGSTRARATPEIPTVAEAGYAGYEASLWYALLVPARTPRTVINRLYAETVKVVRSPGMSEQLLAQGAEPIASSPQEFDAYLRTEIGRWTKLIARANIRPE